MQTAEYGAEDSDKVYAHEAGHALAFYLFGGTIAWASADPYWLRLQGWDGCAGKVMATLRGAAPPEDWDEWHQKNIMASLAGRVGVRLSPMYDESGYTRENYESVADDRCAYVRQADELATLRANRSCIYATGEDVARAAAKAVPGILLAAYRRLLRLLGTPENRFVLLRLRAALEKDEMIDGAAIHDVIKKARRAYRRKNISEVVKTTREVSRAL